MQNKTNWAEFFVWVFMMVVIGLVVLLSRAVSKRRSIKRTKQAESSSGQARVAPWLWALLVFGFALIFFTMSSPKKGARPVNPVFAWASVVMPVILVAVLAGVVYLRHYDRGVSRALKRADEGDVEGAIADLREQIEDKGATQSRANALGILLMRVDRWDEAAALFRKAEELGIIKGVCRANLGLALVKAGKPEEALPVLQETARTGPQVPVLKCLIALHTALALAALGRWDEAREQTLHAESLARALRGAQRETVVRRSRVERGVRG